MSWSATVPAGPCETFSERANEAIKHLLDQGRNAEYEQACQAADVAGEIIANRITGQQDTAWGANLHGHVGGDLTFGVTVHARPVPAAG